VVKYIYCVRLQE